MAIVKHSDQISLKDTPGTNNSRGITLGVHLWGPQTSLNLQCNEQEANNSETQKRHNLCSTSKQMPQTEEDMIDSFELTEHDEQNGNEVSSSEYDSDELDDDSQEDKEEEDRYEECNSTDEEELLIAFAPRTSWRDQEGENVVTQQTNVVKFIT